MSTEGSSTTPENPPGTGIFDPDADALAQSQTGECAKISRTDYCGVQGYSYYSEFENGDYRFVVISGIPSHPAEFNQTHVNPNVRCKFTPLFVNGF